MIELLLHILIHQLDGLAYKQIRGSMLLLAVHVLAFARRC